MMRKHMGKSMPPWPPFFRAPSHAFEERKPALGGDFLLAVIAVLESTLDQRKIDRGLRVIFPRDI